MWRLWKFKRNKFRARRDQTIFGTHTISAQLQWRWVCTQSVNRPIGERNLFLLEMQSIHAFYPREVSDDAAINGE